MREIRPTFRTLKIAVVLVSVIIAYGGTIKPSAGYLHYTSLIEGDATCIQRGDPSAIADFSIMSSATADSLVPQIFELLWEIAIDPAAHDDIRNKATIYPV